MYAPFTFVILYMDGPKAQHCSYCGSVIERSKMYSNMFERIRAQSEFADDNDDVYIVTNTAMLAEVIKSERENVLSYLKETYGI